MVRRFLSWCRSHPLLWTVVGLIVVMVSTHFFLNWLSERRWQRYVTEARARGVKLAGVELARPPIPDDVNFAAIPMLKAAFAGNSARPFELPDYRSAGATFGNALKGERIDWVVWQNVFQQAGYLADVTADPISDTLRALDHYAPQFQEWSEWRSRPRSQFDLDFKLGPAMPMSHLGTFQRAATVFGLRMRAHLALGDSASAYQDFQEGLQAYLALREEPTLIDDLVRVSVLAILIGAVGDGLMDRAWNEEDLRKIEADFSSIHGWEDFRRGMEGEQACSNSIFDSWIKQSSAQRMNSLAIVTGIGGSANQSFAVLIGLVPTRVFRANQLRHNHYLDELRARVDAAGRHYDPERPTPSSPEYVTGEVSKILYFPTKLISPIYTQIERKHLLLQAQLDQVRMACALGRFRMARGAFPAALDELVPDFMTELPLDSYTRGSYQYRLSGQGSYLLYSVGADRRDDSGVLDPNKPATRQVDDVWLYAPRVSAP